ncbi:Glycosyltransferase involved in cell wall bisynthesis [Desulfonatronum thiosulfatophilum]|uniref:Glycosyltransferase involved in cell wall bisynthesis n=1 Tax=Desulfonatronum thiosulfatophilum TaxID=617002 RepID=A0A1G6DEH0_9BACT|nr:glycosyltransferase family 1 protein [Desulfonatronum thiosulfatophilum]SDB43567.1 Glycosyltransferase involved in cell wall bisynthesis [Desulfonatronum thiosulfatophilum]
MKTISLNSGMTRRPIRIGLNLLYLLPGIVGGTETYASGLLRGLAEVDDQLEYVVFMNQESARWPLPEIPVIRRVICPVRATNRLQRLAFEQTRLPAMAREHDLDLMHSLGNVSPIFNSCPSVVTIHDINIKGHGRSMPLLKRVILAFLVRRGAYATRAVITNSEFSRGEIHRHLGLPLDRIHVVPLASDLRDDILSEQSGFASDTDTPDQPGEIDGPYILAFASQSSHKNIPRLIEAFARIAPSFPHNLVLAGHLPRDGATDAAIARWNMTDRVRITGFLPRANVMRLMEKAELFVFPSLYEGFGLPLLEAQTMGTPVACAQRGALPEVAGESAVYFDPEQVLDMAATLAHLLSDEELRTQLVAKGYKNQQRFSWTAAARKTLDIYAMAAWRGRNRFVGKKQSPAHKPVEDE